MPALVYGHLIAALIADRFLALPGCATVGGVVFAAWMYWSPWIFAIPLTQQQHKSRQWYSRWN